MTYDTERTPRIPTGSPAAAEQSPVTTDRSAEQSPVTPDRTTGRANEQSPVTTDRAAGKSPVTTDRANEQSPATTDRATGQSPATTDRATGQSPATTDRAAEQSPVSTDRSPAGHGRSAGQPHTGSSPTGDTAAPANRPLFREGDQEKLALRLQQAVTEFVENPLRAVEEAEGTFDAAVDGLAHALKERRREIDVQQQGKESGTRTEELRIALQQYRDLTERLLKI
ncbi:hypothetical protein [Streptomyces sp. NPDC088730]|uniref:hypothetical protein n=1 Tax=Streptomyces sp. NPDC088730 TaxID=3365877 RepID=UPI00380907C7